MVSPPPEGEGPSSSAPAIIPKIAEALVNTYRTIGEREREAEALRKGKSVKRKLLFKPKKKKK